MGKKVATFFIGVLALLVFPSTAFASLLVIDEGGQVVWKVLSEKDSIALEIPRHSFIEIKKAARKEADEGSRVNLTKTDDKISLVVTSNNETRELDVSGWENDLVEIEQRGEIQKIIVGVVDNKFSLEQKGIKALTDFPIEIDAKTAEFSVKTSTGNRFISVLPFEVVETLLRSKLLNKITNNEIQILEQERELQYVVSGEKVINVLGFFQYSVPVSASLSVSTGEILGIEAPIWYKAISFLFT